MDETDATRISECTTEASMKRADDFPLPQKEVVPATRQSPLHYSSTASRPEFSGPERTLLMVPLGEMMDVMRRLSVICVSGEHMRGSAQTTLAQN